MIREMRRKDKLMDKAAAEQVLLEQTHGVLACLGDDDYPYAVPLSYAYENGKLWFHCSSAGGNKLDAIKRQPKVSFCVVSRDDIVQKDITTHFTSVIVFGQARILTDPAEIAHAAQIILDKYCPDYPEEGRQYTAKTMGKFFIVEIDAELITGKSTPQK